MKFLSAVLLLLACLVVTSSAQSEGGKQLLPFNWDQQPITGTPFYYSVRDNEGNLQWDTHLWWPVLYDNRTLSELNQSWFRPGHGTLLAVAEQYGNQILVCHSGTVNQQPLECEEWRRFFEPLDEFWSTTPYTPEQETRLENRRLELMASVVGWRVRMLQGNSPEVTFEVVDVSHIPHEAVTEFRQDTQVMADHLQEHSVNPTAWELAKTAPEQYLIVVFCGWGPYIQGTTDVDPFGDNYWGTWSRYGVLLKPLSGN
jgi:hypothetical protein